MVLPLHKKLPKSKSGIFSCKNSAGWGTVNNRKPRIVRSWARQQANAFFFCLDKQRKVEFVPRSTINSRGQFVALGNQSPLKVVRILEYVWNANYRQIVAKAAVADKVEKDDWGPKWHWATRSQMQNVCDIPKGPSRLSIKGFSRRWRLFCGSSIQNYFCVPFVKCIDACYMEKPWALVDLISNSGGIACNPNCRQLNLKIKQWIKEQLTPVILQRKGEIWLLSCRAAQLASQRPQKTRDARFKLSWSLFCSKHWKRWLFHKSIIS